MLRQAVEVPPHVGRERDGLEALPPGRVQRWFSNSEAAWSTIHVGPSAGRTSLAG